MYRQVLSSEFLLDAEGHPAGGHTTGAGLDIRWQNGPIVVAGRNGAILEDLIQAATDRLVWYQAAAGGEFACRENALAITKLQEALHWLDHRTADRRARGVEGKHLR